MLHSRKRRLQRLRRSIARREYTVDRGALVDAMLRRPSAQVLLVARQARPRAGASTRRAA